MGRDIQSVITSRVLVLDGAMGTMIKGYGLTEEDYRGARFVSSAIRLQGNHDLLSLTHPEIISEIHNKYLEAGADIIETNTFNSNRISMGDYQMEKLVPEFNLSAAKIAVAAAEKYSALTPGKPRFVAGSMGPTNKSASIPRYINEPLSRSVSFDDLYTAYQEQAESLIDGGVDLLLVETIVDNLNAKAAVKAIFDIFNTQKMSLPVMISFALPQNCNPDDIEHSIISFLKTLSNPSFFSVGINCCTPIKEIKQCIRRLSDQVRCYISYHPNAGLPDESGNYPVNENRMTETLKDILDDRLVNIIGGCCGTTPEYIRRMAEFADQATPRVIC